MDINKGHKALFDNEAKKELYELKNGGDFLYN